MAQLLKLQLKAEGPAPKVEISRKAADTKINYTHEYGQLKSEKQKSNYLETILNNPILKPATKNSPEAQRIIAFLNQSNVQNDLDEYADSLKETVRKMNPLIKNEINALSRNKIEQLNVKTLEEANAQKEKNAQVKAFDDKKRDGETVESHAKRRAQIYIQNGGKVSLDNAEKIFLSLENVKNPHPFRKFRHMAAQFDEHRDKQGRTEKERTAERKATQDYVLKTYGQEALDELKNLFKENDVKRERLQSQQDALRYSNLAIENNSSITNDTSSLQSSATTKKLYETLNQLISDIRGSKVRELLAEARKAIESEIKKIDEAKAEFRSELKKIEEGNATNKKELINALEKKLTEKVKGSLDAIKNKLLDVTKNLNIDSGSLEKAVNTVTQKLQNVPKNLSPEEKVNFQTNLVMTMMIALLDKAKEQNENEIQPNDVQKIKQTIEQKFDDIMKVASSSVNTPPSINKQNATASILNSLENGMTILKKEMRGITFDDSKIQSLKLKFPEKLSTLSSLGVIRSVAKEMTKDIEMMMSQGNVSEEAIKKTVDDLLKKVKEIFGEIKQGIKGDIIKAALKDLPELMNKLFKTEADENNTIDGVLKEFSMEMNKMFTEQKESQLA